MKTMMETTMNKMNEEKSEAVDTRYMQRALTLAANGAGSVSPNPMVGAVITARGRIIGEGWHRRFGEGHAEVNAVASVSHDDLPLLKEATIYVTLEPCSHYGKTPPCARLLIEKGLKRVVVGSPDPNPLVAGRGVKMLREAGIEVVEEVMREECDALNRRFLTAQRLRRPWIQLKWAQSADGFMGLSDDNGKPAPARYSTPLTTVGMHRERAMADAILAGTGTLLSDNPSLTIRRWPGRNPLRISFNSPHLPVDCRIMTDDNYLLLPTDAPLAETMQKLFSENGVSSLMVEGGAETLRRFIEAGLYDEIRRETAPLIQTRGVKAPRIPDGMTLTESAKHDGNIIEVWRR